MMLNVVNFPGKTSRLQRSAARPSPDGEVDDAPRPVSPLRGWPSKARSELHDAILMLDLAAQHARQLVDKFSDPRSRKLLEGNLMVIEELLQLARDKTMRL